MDKENYTLMSYTSITHDSDFSGLWHETGIDYESACLLGRNYEADFVVSSKASLDNINPLNLWVGAKAVTADTETAYRFRFNDAGDDTEWVEAKNSKFISDWASTRLIMPSDISAGYCRALANEHNAEVIAHKYADLGAVSKLCVKPGDKAYSIKEKRVYMRDINGVWVLQGNERGRSENDTCKPESSENDPVNNPSHYTDGKIGVIDFIEDKKLGYRLGNAIKYISRAGKKDASKYVQDLKKAIWYINREIKNHE